MERPVTSALRFFGFILALRCDNVEHFYTALAIALLYISFFLVGYCGDEPPSKKDLEQIRLHVAVTASVHESRCGGLTEQRLLSHLTMDNTSTG